MNEKKYSPASVPALPAPIDQFPYEQEQALACILQRADVFLTGPALSGLPEIAMAAAYYLEDDGLRTLRCSFSNAAAARICGRTLNSVLRLPLDLMAEDSLAEPDVSELQKADVLIVYEISACPPPLIDIIIEAVSMVRRQGHHLQVVFIGDLYKLPPVHGKDQKATYEKITGQPLVSWQPCYAVRWKELNLTLVSLDTPLHQEMAPFFKSLSSFRTGDWTDYGRFLETTSPEPIPDAVWLYGTNGEADGKNKEGFDRIPAQSYTFNAIISGDVPMDHKKSFECLRLKEGLKIIFAANIWEKGISYGDTGIVTRIEVPGDKCGHESIHVSTTAGTWFTLGKKTWYFYDDSKNTIGSLTQYPLMPGYALTVHKSQSMTFAAANITPRFLNRGQFYTALSCVKDPASIYISQCPDPMGQKADKAITTWYAREILGGSETPVQSISSIPFLRRDGLRFGVYVFDWETETDGNWILNKRSFICLRNEENQVIALTDFDKYVRSTGMKRLASDIGDRLYHVTNLLNYSFIDVGHIDRLEELTPELIQGFLQSYGLGEYGKTARHTEKTVRQCFDTILKFIHGLLSDSALHLSFSEKDLFQKKPVWSDKKGLLYRVSPNLSFFYIEEDHVTIRDMPLTVVERMLSIAYYRHPEILFNLAAGLCCGLRPSEACCLDASHVKIVQTGGKIIQVQFDLRHVVRLRNDGVLTGSIKKPRIAEMPKMFLELFQKCWERYTAWRNKQPVNPGSFNPMCLDSHGMAMTYQTYERRFKDLMRETVDSLRSSSDLEVKLFIKDHDQYGVSPHVMRHIYTMILAASGATEAMIMEARGDTSVQSALVYLQKKGLLQKYKAEIIDLLLKSIAEAAGC